MSGSYGPIQAKARSIQDQSLNTGIEVLELVKNEVFSAVYKSELIFEELIKIGVIKEVSSKTAEAKNIPVVLLNEDGKELPLTSKISI